MGEKIKSAIYSRVSTSGQEVSNQTEVLKAWAEQRDFEVVGLYEEMESAWRGGHQRELSRLFADARQCRFKIVLCWALDRMSREGAMAILTIVHKLSRMGITVISHEEGWTESGGEIAELLYAVTGWISRMESQRLSARTLAGLARAKMEGKRLGRPPGAKDKKKREKRSPRMRSISGTDY